MDHERYLPDRRSARPRHVADPRGHRAAPDRAPVRRAAAAAVHFRVVRIRSGAGPRAGLRPRQARLVGHALEGLRLRRLDRNRLRPGVPGARGHRQRTAQPGVGAGLAGDVRDLPVGQRGAAHAVAARDGHRRRHRLLRPHRARLRVQPLRHAHNGAPRRVGLDPQRLEDVDHQRHGRRYRDRLGARGGRASSGSSCPQAHPGSARAT